MAVVVRYAEKNEKAVTPQRPPLVRRRPQSIIYRLVSLSMLKLWPTSPGLDADLTPRPRDDNPFDSLSPSIPSFQHRLLNTHSPLPSPTVTSFNFTAYPISPGLGAAPASAQLSFNPPNFAIKQPPLPHRMLADSAPNATASGAVSKGQIHVKLIQARGLNVGSVHARPYAVVQFEQNEFVSRDPTDESDKEVKGTATNRNGGTPSGVISRDSSNNALSALGRAAALDVQRKRGQSTSSSPSSSVSSGKSDIRLSTAKPTVPPANLNGGLFTKLSAHNPVWKHEVSFDVTSSASMVTLNVYDRSIEEQGFLGTVQIKPALVHDHTVDQWYKLLPFENEIISGEIRVQITFEQYKNKRALAPRDFEFLKLVGRGTFGKVFQVRKRDTKRIYAMKVLSKKEIVAKKEIAHTIGERKILQRSLESPFLVGLKFSFQTDADLYLVTDFKSGGELFWHLQRETRFSEERARFYIAELVLALEHLHKYDIVYRDLKPENILLDATGHIALCDFGLSKPDLRADELTRTFCGTTEYLAPEILLDEHGYSKIVDFWSLGVLLFEMCCGWSPFYSEDMQTMYKNICFGKIRFPKGVINEDGKQFVKGLLNRNPKHRLGAQRDAAELKEHPFFKSIDWNALALKQLTPPFKPVVESDESTSNFDPEFTSADLRSVGLTDSDLDEEDPSEAWVSKSINSSSFHQPNGPLGSQGSQTSLVRVNSKGALVPTLAPLSPADQKSTTQPPRSNKSSANVSGGIQIKTKKSQKNPTGSPLTKSVQENFRGFTYSGNESVITPLGVLGGRSTVTNEEAVADEETTDVNTEDELEEVGHSVGRYANARKKGLGMSDLDDMDA